MPRNTTEKNDQEDKHSFPQEEESLQSLCQQIREKRISKKLSLESVSGHLHIATKILKAIEDGKPENGPTPVFFRGLVRTYCQFLELDKTEIIDKIDNFLKVEDPSERLNTKNLQPVASIKKPQPIRNIITILVILLSGYLIYSFNSIQKSFFITEDNATNQKFVAEEEAIIKVKKTVATKIQETANVDKSFTEKMELKKELTVVTNLGEIKTETAKSTEKKLVTNLLEPLTLEVEAIEGTWVSISVDGKEIKDYRLEADEIQQWEAKENYLLTLGNSQVVRVLLNGREIETNRTNHLLRDWLVNANLMP